MYESFQMMNNIVANKLFLIKQLKLPIELTCEISSYCFYDVQASFIRNKMRSITQIFKSPLINGRNDMGDWWFYIEYGEKQFQAQNCTSCGNYIVTNNYDTTDSVLCSCIYREDTYIDNDYQTIEDIENEEEEYRNYRADRLETIMGW